MFSPEACSSAEHFWISKNINKIGIALKMTCNDIELLKFISNPTQKFCLHPYLLEFSKAWLTAPAIFLALWWVKQDSIVSTIQKPYNTP